MGKSKVQSINDGNLAETVQTVGGATAYRMLLQQFTEEELEHRKRLEDEVREDQQKKDRVYSEFLGKLGIAGIVLAVAALIFTIYHVGTHYGNLSAIEGNKAFIACSNGDEAACLVEVKKLEAEEDYTKWQKARDLRVLYRNKVGKELAPGYW